MFATEDKQVVLNSAQYIDKRGTKYPSSFPREQISGLYKVSETDPPNDPSLVVTGFIIDKANTQIWQTRPKTTDEIKDDIKVQIVALEATVTQRRLRQCFVLDQKFADEGRAWIANVEMQIATLRTQL